MKMIEAFIQERKSEKKRRNEEMKGLLAGILYP